MHMCYTCVSTYPKQNIFVTSFSGINSVQISIARSNENDILLVPREDDLFKWTGFVAGPPDSAFAGGWFKLKFELSNSYPQCPPKVLLLTAAEAPQPTENSGIHDEALKVPRPFN